MSEFNCVNCHDSNACRWCERGRKILEERRQGMSRKIYILVEGDRLLHAREDRTEAWDDAHRILRDRYAARIQAVHGGLAPVDSSHAVPYFNKYLDREYQIWIREVPLKEFMEDHGTATT